MLERDAELSALAHAAREAADRHGSVVLIMGEAGIGKSSLVEALRSHLPAEGRMLVGYCDDLATPRTLGPFRDLVGSVGTELSRAVTDGSERDRVLAALRTELTWPDHPTVLVIEDVHWADDATLDALRYLIRRIADLPAVLVLTYRDDELNRGHPLHGLLGQASRSDHVRRLPLRRLSQQADRTCRGSSITPRKQVTRTPSSGTARPPHETRPVLGPIVRPSPTSVSYWSTRAGSPRVSGPNCWHSTRSSATRSERSTRRSKPGSVRSRRTGH